MSPPAAPPASASELTPDAALVERFRRDLASLLAAEAAQTPPLQGVVAARGADGGVTSSRERNTPPPRLRRGLPPLAGEDLHPSPLALAVSGGADSMAMLLLAAAACPGRIIAATVSHGLRADAAIEAALVASLCERLGVPHAILNPLQPIAGSSLQRQARIARYAALEIWMAAHGARCLLTAHHADDQAETLLMRLNRASGATGLSGIRPVRRSGDVLVLRPLLRWRRRELREVCEAAGIEWAEDPSNADARHDRTRYRHFLAGQTLLSPGALAAAAAHIAETDAALARLIEPIAAERWSPDHGRLDAAGLPREVRRRLVRRAIAHLRERHGVTAPHFSDASNVEALLDSLDQGRAATQAGILVTPRGAIWTFALAPARRSH